jgi:RHS repeat-associated protein
MHDHLGSARITLDNSARVIESRSYMAFGEELTSSGTGARTSYIGRETDNESDLGFGACPEALRGSVRMYEPLYGRFLSTDPLWAKYLPLQSYQYAGNEPLHHTDRSGFVVVFEGKEFEEAHNKIYEEKDSKGNYVNGAYRARFDKLHASDVNYVVRNTKVEDSEQMSGGRAGTLPSRGVIDLKTMMVFSDSVRASLALQVLPSITHDRVTVVISGIAQQGKGDMLEVTDLTGRIIASLSVPYSPATLRSQLVDLSQLPTGYYLLRLAGTTAAASVIRR